MTATPNNEAGARYRKKPVVIEARLFQGGAESATPIVDWILAGGGTARWREATPPYNDGTLGHPGWPEYLAIDTLEGTMDASPGDWIIRGVQGEFYPCKPEIFAATYEPATGRTPSAFVPGVMGCAKCKLRLVRCNLNARDGTVTAGDSTTEPCPNGCGPLWPVTWEQEARECWERIEELTASPTPRGGELVAVPRVPTYQMAEALGVKWEAGEGFPRRWAAMLAVARGQTFMGIPIVEDPTMDPHAAASVPVRVEDAVRAFWQGYNAEILVGGSRLQGRTAAGVAAVLALVQQAARQGPSA